jgi:hypothetical protein
MAALCTETVPPRPPTNPRSAPTMEQRRIAYDVLPLYRQLRQTLQQGALRSSGRGGRGRRRSVPARRDRHDSALLGRALVAMPAPPPPALTPRRRRGRARGAARAAADLRPQRAAHPDVRRQVRPAAAADRCLEPRGGTHCAAVPFMPTIQPPTSSKHTSRRAATPRRARMAATPCTRPRCGTCWSCFSWSRRRPRASSQRWGGGGTGCGREEARHSAGGRGRLLLAAGLIGRGVLTH